MDRFDPFVKYADVYGDIINWEKDPMNKPQNQNKYFFSDGKTYYEQICKMLRLMSVFKEAFNQIYSNEDEISEAWENFVNNLSASVVEGSEPDVTLTWTDDSVNFEFTMVPGVPGEQGVGITSISFNSDYTMTITLSDGNTYTSMSLKGETGPQGPQGETGSGLQILDVYATLADLQSAHPTGQPGDAYQVGSAGNYTLYIWSSSQSAWIPAGSLGTVSPSTSNPLMDGTASAGSSNLYSRGDHVHPSDTSRASKEELDALIKTSQSLIDQSFTYRESPAIQDGLARIDKIKGNTLVWNQLVQNGNFADTSNWYTRDGATLTVSDNVGTLVTTSANISAIINRFSYVQGHKYLIKLSAKSSSGQILGVGLSNNGGTLGNPKMNITATSTWQEYSVVDIATSAPSASAGDNGLVIRNNNASAQTVELKNVQIFDLTKMGLDFITSVEEFTSIFPISYYAYNQGSLLSFNGNGIKTVGFNQWDEEWEDGSITSSGVLQPISSAIRSKNFCPCLPNTTYYLRMIEGSTGQAICWYDSAKNFIIRVTDQGTRNAISPSNASYFKLSLYNYKIQDYVTYNNDVCLNISDTLKNGTYEPYTSSTLSLPVSTYFPNGMDGVGDAYDEISNSRYAKRMGRIDLGSITYTIQESQTSGVYFFVGRYNSIPNIKNKLNSVVWNIKTPLYETVTSTEIYYGRAQNKTIGGYDAQTVRIRDDSFTDPTEFKNSLSGQYLVYELATPTETSIDADLDFICYEDGTEQLLPLNGPVPSTSPVIADMTYLSIDDAMKYILEKLANVPQNTQQILESLEDDVADLQTDTGALQSAVSGLQTSVGNINTNIGQLSSTVAGHTASISDMQSDISDLNTGLNDLNTGLNDLEDTVTNNTSRIGTLETGLTNTDSQVDAIDARVLNLETDLLIVVKKEYDYDSVAGNTDFGVQTGLSQEPGYKIIGIVGSEVQQGEHTSAESWIIVTQAHVHYTSTGGVVLSMMARNVSEYTKTNVRVYLYLLCIKDTQSQ